MNKPITASLLLAALLLAGCAAPQPQKLFYKTGATRADYEADTAKCVYEVTAATQTTDTSMRTIFGQELDRSIRRRDLAVLCLKARGWRLE